MNPFTDTQDAALARRAVPVAIVHPETDGAARKQAMPSHRVTASVSSEAPVRRGYGWEILGHGAGEVDLSALNAGAVPILADHDNRTGAVLGHVERARIEGGRLVVDLVFADTEAGRDAAAKVKAGNLRNLSIGYDIQRMEKTGERDGLPEYRATLWTVREVSLVAVPADFSIGVGRNLSAKGDTMTVETSGTPRRAKAETAPAVATRSIEAGNPALDERERVSAILGLGKRFQAEGLAESAIREGATVEQFNARLVEHMASSPMAFERAGQFDDWGGHKDRAEVANFSVTRALTALVTGDRDKAGLELAVSRTIEQASKKTARGVMVPPHALVSRAVLTSSSDSGIAAITENYMSHLFDDALRAESVIFQAGAQQLNGLSGDARIPRLGTGLTGTWVAEEEPAVESDLALETVDLKPHQLSWMMRMSRRTLTQSALSMEEVVRRDIRAGIFESVDAAALVGSTDDVVAPRGIINTSGVGTVAVETENKPTWAEVINFITEIETSNIDGKRLAYVMRPEVRGYLMATPKVLGDAAMMMDAPDRLAGYRALATMGMPANNAAGGSILFGDFSHLFVGLFGGIDITVDPYTYADRGTTRITAFSDWGVAVRRPQAFAVVDVA